MRRLPIFLLALSNLASAAGAELVIFTDGGFIKVDDFQREGERLHLDLPTGGRMTVSLLRIDRILEDEVTDEEPAPVLETPAFELRFDLSQPQPATRFGEEIYGASQRHKLNPALVAAVVRAESAFDPNAVSHKGAQGLMQLMPATARRFGLSGKDVFEPVKNLDAGARYLSWLMDHFDGDLPRVLAAYNAGEGTVRRYGGVPPYRETRKYLARIYGFLGLDGAALATASGPR